MTISEVRLLTPSKMLRGVFAVNKELESRVHAICGMIHCTLKERAAFRQMNHTPNSMDYIDQVTIDYIGSPGKQTTNVGLDESSN